MDEDLFEKSDSKHLENDILKISLQKAQTLVSLLIGLCGILVASLTIAVLFVGWSAYKISIIRDDVKAYMSQEFDVAINTTNKNNTKDALAYYLSQKLYKIDMSGILFASIKKAGPLSEDGLRMIVDHFNVLEMDFSDAEALSDLYKIIKILSNHENSLIIDEFFVKIVALRTPPDIDDGGGVPYNYVLEYLNRDLKKHEKTLKLLYSNSDDIKFRIDAWIGNYDLPTTLFHLIKYKIDENIITLTYYKNNRAVIDYLNNENYFRESALSETHRTDASYMLILKPDSEGIFIAKSSYLASIFNKK